MTKNSGFTLIDVIVGVSLTLIVFSGIFGAYQLGIKVVSQSKARITAIALANQKIEMARNLSYDSVGTVGGVPSGALPETELTTRNNTEYTVKTTVVYVDDPFDGILPADSTPADYKRIKVQVSWAGRFSGRASLTTDVAPKGVESELEGGTLSLVVFDAQGAGLPQVNVHVVNSRVSPVIDAWYFTDNNGELVLAGVPESEESYQINVSKSGYSQDRTYSEDELDSPLKPHASIYEGQLTEISFSIDKTSSLTMQTRGSKGGGYPPVHGVTFTMRGSKIIGQDEGEPVYKYSINHTTNGPAEIAISDLEWDSYSFSISQPAGLDLVEIESPLGATTTQPIEVLPDTASQARLILGAENSLLVTVINSSTSEPVFGAEVRLFDSGLGYDVAQPTGEDGKTFFIPLEESEYDLTAAMAGYQNFTGTVLVSDDTLKSISLNPLP